MAGLTCLSSSLKQISKLAIISKNTEKSDKFLSIIRGNRLRCMSGLSQLQNDERKEEWYLSASVFIERIPILTPPLTDFENKMVKHLKQIEFESSKKSDFELRNEADIEAAEKRKLEGLKLASGTRTAEDDHDAWVKDKQSFIGKSRITQADEKGIRSSVVRCLDKPLHLIIERNFGYQNNSKAKPEYNWDLPCSIRQEGESMRQVAERAVRNTCGSDLNVHILGNAPWAFFKYRYSNKIQDITGKRGEKIFIYKAHYQSGQAKAQENITRDYRWSTIDELDESIAPKLKVILKELMYIDDCES